MEDSNIVPLKPWQLDPMYKCVWCGYIVQLPVFQFLCGHRVCGECHVDLQVLSNQDQDICCPEKCPESGESFQDFAMKRDLNEVQVYCGKGCSAVLLLGEYENHMNICSAYSQLKEEAGGENGDNDKSATYHITLLYRGDEFAEVEAIIRVISRICSMDSQLSEKAGGENGYSDKSVKITPYPRWSPPNLSDFKPSISPVDSPLSKKGGGENGDSDKSDTISRYSRWHSAQFVPGKSALLNLFIDKVTEARRKMHEDIKQNPFWHDEFDCNPYIETSDIDSALRQNNPCFDDRMLLQEAKMLTDRLIADWIFCHCEIRVIGTDTDYIFYTGARSNVYVITGEKKAYNQKYSKSSDQDPTWTTFREESKDIFGNNEIRCSTYYHGMWVEIFTSQDKINEKARKENGTSDNDENNVMDQKKPFKDGMMQRNGLDQQKCFDRKFPATKVVFPLLVIQIVAFVIFVFGFDTQITFERKFPATKVVFLLPVMQIMVIQMAFFIFAFAVGRLNTGVNDKHLQQQLHTSQRDKSDAKDTTRKEEMEQNIEKDVTQRKLKAEPNYGYLAVIGYFDIFDCVKGNKRNDCTNNCSGECQEFVTQFPSGEDKEDQNGIDVSTWNLTSEHAMQELQLI